MADKPTDTPEEKPTSLEVVKDDSELRGKIKKHEGKISWLEKQLQEATGQRDELQAKIKKADDTPAPQIIPDAKGKSLWEVVEDICGFND